SERTSLLLGVTRFAGISELRPLLYRPEDLCLALVEGVGVESCRVRCDSSPARPARWYRATTEPIPMNSAYRIASQIFRSGAVISALCVLVSRSADGQRTTRRPLSAVNIDDLATLEMLEDRRQFDSTELARLLASNHP